MENNEGKIFEVPKWEYKKIPLDTENDYKELAELGKKGWDAVGFPTVDSGSHGRTPNLLLKRQIGTVRLMEVTKEQSPSQTQGRDGGYSRQSEEIMSATWR